MSPVPPHDPFQTQENAWAPRDTPSSIPAVKRTRTSRGVRLVFSLLILAFVSLGVWLGAQLLQPHPAVDPSALTTPPLQPSALKSASIEITKSGPEPAQATSSEIASAPVISEPVGSSPLKAEPVPDVDSLDSLKKKLTDTPQPSTSLFLEVAAAFTTKKLHSEATGILSKGILQHPENDELFLALVDSVFASGDRENAWQQTARTGRLSDPRYASRILRFGLAAAKYDETLVILSSSGATSPKWSEDDWIMIATLYENSGQLDKAIATVTRKVTGKSEISRLRARQETLNENLTEAIFHQEQYIASLDNPGVEAWRNLATLYASLGRTEDAKRALEQSSNAESGTPSDATPNGAP